MLSETSQRVSDKAKALYEQKYRADLGSTHPLTIEFVALLAAAVGVSPRIGHLHVTVDDLPWHWADANGSNTIIVVGLPVGPHKITIELADPTHRVLTGQTVSFVIPVQAH